MMVLQDKVIDALKRARKADQERQKEGITLRQQKRANEQFAAATEVLFYLIDSDQAR